MTEVGTLWLNGTYEHPDSPYYLSCNIKTDHDNFTPKTVMKHFEDFRASLSLGFHNQIRYEGLVAFIRLIYTSIIKMKDLIVCLVICIDRFDFCHLDHLRKIRI